MGLTVYYDWKIKADAAAARRLIVKLHALAKRLPFDDLSEIFEQDPPNGQTDFTLYDHQFRQGSLHLPRRRGDGLKEVVSVPATHALFFYARIEGAETASIGLASHPPVVVHREDAIECDARGGESRRIGQGQPIEFATRSRGYHSWHSSCKTQYAANPKLGGEENFLKAHLTLIELLDRIQEHGAKVRIRDDSGYAKHRDVNRLLKSVREWNALIANFVGKLNDAIGDDVGPIVAPILDRPDFEQLEFRGIEVLRKMAARQKRRKKGS